jgi:hypothetical protein
MCNGCCSKEEKEEVIQPLLTLHRTVWRRIHRSIDDVKKQAPGARMVGEFAVKHVANEANKTLKKFVDHSAESNQHVDPESLGD